MKLTDNKTLVFLLLHYLYEILRRLSSDDVFLLFSDPVFEDHVAVEDDTLVAAVLVLPLEVPH